MAAHEDLDAKKAYRKSRDLAQEVKVEIDDAIRSLLAHRNGRQFLWWILQIGKAIGTNPFTNNALVTSFNCGEQNVGQQVMSRITEIDPTGFLTMLKEKQDEHRTRTDPDTGTDSSADTDA